MGTMQNLVLIFVGITGTAVVLTRDPVRQVVGLSFYGLILALLFVFLQAPDAALSQIVIGAVVLPLMFMLSLANIRRASQRQDSDHESSSKGPA
jgi:energy-converting hydrogenase B subunit D